MATRALRRLARTGALPAAVLLVTLFIALTLMSDAVQNSEALSRAFVPLLMLVLAGLLTLATMVGFQVLGLVRRYRRQAAGSRLTGRLLLRFALISLLPVAVVYYFSLNFLLRGIDSWFDVEIGRAMQEALTLNQASLDLNQRTLVKYTETLLTGIEDRSSTALALSLGGLRRQAGAIELTVFGPAGQIYGTANEDPTQLVPDLPEREILQAVRAGTNHVGLESRGNDNELIIRVLVRDPGGRPMQLQAIFPTSERVGELSARLEEAYNRYTELAYLRESLKLSFSLTLSLVLLFGLMAALIAAFYTAGRLVAPIADIARGTRAVADGDYEQQLPTPKHEDELAFLVASFNEMTRRIASARDAADRSQQAVEAQRAYLETVLGRLSSGVVAFDVSHRMRTANPAARQILGLATTPETAPTPDELEREYPSLAPWSETVRRHLDADDDWRTEITLSTREGRQVLMCRGSPLRQPGGEPSGHVVVFDDITTLITAQRDAAWGEVARRLAHEIKNPLTPIQLSTERMRHKLLPTLPEGEAKIVDRATRTIVQQVEAMKRMVKDFSEYARSPAFEATPFVLDKLIADVLDLYRSAGGQTALFAALGTDGARIKGDPLRLRQVVHNLVKNAQEALDQQRDGWIRVSTRCLAGDEGGMLELCVEDNGPGIHDKMLEHLFEPYTTTKAKGTGLGLAIVKKIIEEHGGIIWAENLVPGTRIVSRLPAWQDLSIDQRRHESTVPTEPGDVLIQPDAHDHGDGVVRGRRSRVSHDGEP
ncbi:ATP-binding protein [Thioalkalicoccus limnaeus]|uniref:histidine kinase n=1 Tax=Thioalkalicoccus limnaeus TaxID=120681 RepID=A0ABV4BAF8_9GAMM